MPPCRGPKRKELPFTVKLDTCVPFFCEIPLAIDRVRLAEHGGLPESDIRLGKVAKIFYFLASFAVHLWPFLLSHELVSESLKQLLEAVYRLHGGSCQVISVHFNSMTSDHRVAGSSPAGCKNGSPFTVSSSPFAVGR
jgi:hypothetical protein